MIKKNQAQLKSAYSLPTYALGIRVPNDFEWMLAYVIQHESFFSGQFQF